MIIQPPYVWYRARPGYVCGSDALWWSRFIRGGEPYCIGFNWRRDCKWHVQPTFWLPSEGLSEKTIADRLPYDLWQAQGYLQTTPGRTVSYEHVAHHLRGLFRHYSIAKIGFDRGNMRHFLPWLLKAGFSEQFVKDHFVEFGQGMQSMSRALRDLEQVPLEGQIAHGNHPVLSMCA
jgi:phage terminase large subunit-like protein